MSITTSLRLFFPLSFFALPACAVGSISDPIPPGQGNTALYRGELSDADVLGLESGHAAQALHDRRDVVLREGQDLLVVQSGALFPDSAMVDGLAGTFRVGTWSGLPATSADALPNLRLAAAKGGFESILCYWGTLETAREAGAGKAAAWVPIARFFVPDESQRMRIRLKLMLVDVATGDWTVLLPEPFADERMSSPVTRYASAVDQVVALKDEAYRDACAQLVQAWVRS